MNLFGIAANQIVLVVILVGLLVVMLVLPMFTNKKRMKAAQEVHNAIQKGTVIKTVGGIIGTVVEVKEISPVDKNIVVETGVGDNKSTLEFDIQAVYQVLSGAATPVAPAKDAKKVDLKKEEVKAEEVKTEEVKADAEQAKDDKKEDK